MSKKEEMEIAEVKEEAREVVSKLTKEDVATLLKHYDADKDGKLTKQEALQIVEHCKVKDFQGVHPEVVAIIKKYDIDGDGVIGEEELKHLTHDVDLVSDSNVRYLGYTAVLSRAFRYLAFTSGT
jgi:Ca2+-binding EF-hand superfamily protein